VEPSFQGELASGEWCKLQAPSSMSWPIKFPQWKKKEGKKLYEIMSLSNNSSFNNH